jgi:hypothetical protein
LAGQVVQTRVASVDRVQRLIVIDVAGLLDKINAWNEMQQNATPAAIVLSMCKPP